MFRVPTQRGDVDGRAKEIYTLGRGNIGQKCKVLNIGETSAELLRACFNQEYLGNSHGDMIEVFPELEDLRNGMLGLPDFQIEDSEKEISAVK